MSATSGRPVRTWFAGWMLACAALAQSPALPNPPALLPPAWLRAFDLHAGTVQSLHVPSAPASAATIDVSFAGRPVTLELAPYDLRSASFQLWTRTAGGLVPLPTPPATTWRGTIAGDPGSAVAATLDGGGLTAWVRTGGGEWWGVQPLRSGVPAAPAALHVVHRGSDGAALHGRCGVVAPSVPVPAGGGGDVLYECELALEADHPLFLANGASVAATQNDVLGVLNAVELIFQTDVQVDFVVTQLIVDTAPDPYTTSNASALLTQFQNHWNTAHGAIPRDVAHLFSGRQVGAASNGVVGIAYVGAVCATATSYGLSETRWSANFGYRVGVTAHELGHNFNASHCDGQPACAVMCATIGGCSGNVGSFSPGEQAQIVAYRQVASCLVVQPTLPAITGLNPAQVATVQPVAVTLTGSGFVGTTAVAIGTTQLTSGFQVVSDTQIQLTPPYGLALGSHPVTVTNPAGTSNAATLTYNAANPCVVVVPNATFGGQSMYWRMGGWPNDPAFLGISIFSTTSPFLGFPLLDGFLLLWNGVLDARGMATLTVTVPPGLLTGVTIRSQLLDLDPVTSTLRSVSSTPATWIVF